jgi:hypothetical protein
MHFLPLADQLPDGRQFSARLRFELARHQIEISGVHEHLGLMHTGLWAISADCRCRF